MNLSPWQTAAKTILALILLLACGVDPVAQASVQLFSPQDFNRHACADLVVGVSGESKETAPAVQGHGAIQLLLSSPDRTGLSATGNQAWDQDSVIASGPVIDQIETYDNFGSVLQWGDFNGDRFNDLAIGIEYEDIGAVSNAGAVQVFSGSALGFSGLPDKFFVQGPSLADVPEVEDRFGGALASGDFNGDGFDDLAASARWEDLPTSPVANTGAVHILFGGIHGLTVHNNQFITQDDPSLLLQVNTLSDSFGWSLAAGDFNGDGFDDLAIDEIGATVGGFTGAGAVTILFGSSTGLTTAGNQYFHQDTKNVSDSPEKDDYFGFALAAADFNLDGFDDLAVGVSDEDFGLVSNAGMVHVLPGSPGGLNVSQPVPAWFQGNLCDFTEDLDRFSDVMTTGDLNGDHYPELILGVSQEDFNGKDDAGMVMIVYSGPAGLTTAGARCIAQEDIPGLASNDYDYFSKGITVGDFNCDHIDDLAIGVLGEDISTATRAGKVVELHGSSAGISTTWAGLWHQGGNGLLGIAEKDDYFGAALASAPIHWRYQYMPVAWKK